MVMDRPTFSSSWSRVSRLTPRLRSHAQIHRQLFQGRPWHVVHDPLANQFFRLNPVAYHFVALLDGRRSVDDAWQITLDQYGDQAPTQNEVIGLLGQLNESNLLRIDLPPDAEPLLQRSSKRRWKTWGGQAMSVLFLRFPLFNPDRILDWLVPLFRPLLSRWGAAAMGRVARVRVLEILPAHARVPAGCTQHLVPVELGLAGAAVYGYEDHPRDRTRADMQAVWGDGPGDRGHDPGVDPVSVR